MNGRGQAGGSTRRIAAIIALGAIVINAVDLIAIYINFQTINKLNVELADTVRKLEDYHGVRRDDAGRDK